MSAGGRDRPTPVFRHDQAGTGEPEWLLDPRWDAVAVRSPGELACGVDRVVVVAAHPDDESLGAGATLGDLSRLVDDIVIVLATDGEKSHPTGAFPGELAALRRAELVRALQHVSPAARVVPLALPDGRLAAHTEQLSEVVASLVDPKTVLLAPWRHDGHPDHEAAGRVAAAAAGSAGARLLEFPIWLWHWGGPNDLPWRDILLVTPSAGALHAKRAGVAEHISQVLARSPVPGDSPLLGQHVLARFERVVEAYVCSVPPRAAPVDKPSADAFDSMYEVGDDPWGFTTSWYEQRKRALTTAMLGRPRYRAVLELGCATGALTRALAQRADHVVGVDLSTRALSVAHQSTADVRTSTVSFVHGAVPEAVPEGPFDLVVLSEVGYFLDGARWLATLRRVRSVLEPGGEVAVVNWRRRPHGIPLDGPLVQQQARDALGLTVRAAYADADVEIDILGDGPSVAEREGLA